MRLSVISDIHVLGPSEHERARELVSDIGRQHGMFRALWRHFLHGARNRFWNWKPESRRACFMRALEDMHAYHPDWVIANGDYGGDAEGVGLSHENTYESAAGVITLMREIFPERCHFIFGDHDIGKYSTIMRQGGIRLASLDVGEQQLGIRSFWHERVDDIQLIGVNSSLITLDHFLPEALTEEVPEWRRRREEHEQRVAETFATLEQDARVILFCHDPSALGVLIRNPIIYDKVRHIELTVLGHLHEPRLLSVIQRLPKLPEWKPRYPVARIITEGLRSAQTWSLFKPIVCPSPFGTGHHLSGGLLYVEKNADNKIVARRHRIKL